MNRPFRVVVHQSVLRAVGAAAIAVHGGAIVAPAAAQGPRTDTSYYADLRWRSIGPYRAGNVYAVAGVPGDPTVYYIGTPEAGVWKTTDGGTVWTPIFDRQHMPSIGAVSVAPSDPNVVYVGSGNPSFWSFTPGNGVYKSADAGKTWRRVGLAATQYITSVIVDPHRANVVLVGALGAREFGGGGNPERGVYRTADGGQHWRRVLYKDAYTGVAAMTMDYADPRFVYVALARTTFGLSKRQRDSLAPMGTGIYKSADEGVTWQLVPARGLPATAESFQIAVASGTHGQRVYAEAQGSGRDASALYRSDDGGHTWYAVTTQILSAGGGPIYVDPQHPDVVYLMGTAMYRSTDGGRHVVAYKGSPGGDDPRDLWIDPINSRRMLMGVDQGPTATVDGGETWTPWYNLPNGQFYHVSTDNHFPYRVCAAQQDSGTACVVSRSDFGAIRDNDWYPVGGFEDGYIVTDPVHPRWIFTQGWYHVLRRYDRETGQVAVLYTPAPGDRFSSAPPLAFSPQDPTALYMGAQFVLASSDSGRDWRHLSPDLTAHAGPADSAPASFAFRRAPAIETLAPSAVAAGEIWVGTSNGVIQLTRDGGATWTDVTPPGMPPGAASVHVIDPSHQEAGTAYAAVEVFGDPHPYVFRTSDFGQHWQSIVSGLPDDAAVRVVRSDPDDPALVYAGTLMGVSVSFDRGDHWQPLQLNLPNTVVTDMDVHGNDLVISTYGRALWILDDLTPLRQIRAVMAASAAAYLFQPEPAYRVRWDNIQDTPLPPEVPTGDNPPEGAIIDYYLTAPPSGPISLSIYDADRHLIRQYSSTAPPPDSTRPNIAEYWFEPARVLPAGPGMHRVAWDLRYPPPAVVNYSYFGDLLNYREYTLNTHAIKGHTPRIQPSGPLVVPGTYRVELTVGGQVFAQELRIENDPRVPISQTGLGNQLHLEQQMMAGMQRAYDEFDALQRLRAAVTAAAARVSPAQRSGPWVAALGALGARAGALADGPDGNGFGPANRDLTRHLEDMESGDIDPTPSDIAAVEASCRVIDAALVELGELERADLPSVNAALAEAHLPTLPASPVASGPACAAP